MIQGRNYKVSHLDEDGYLKFDGTGGMWKPENFELVERQLKETVMKQFKKGDTVKRLKGFAIGLTFGNDYVVESIDINGIKLVGLCDIYAIDGFELVKTCFTNLNDRIKDKTFAELSLEDKIEITNIRLSGDEVECSTDNKNWKMCYTLKQQDGIHMYAGRYYRIKVIDHALLQAIDGVEDKIANLQKELELLKDKIG